MSAVAMMLRNVKVLERLTEGEKTQRLIVGPARTRAAAAVNAVSFCRAARPLAIAAHRVRIGV